MTASWLKQMGRALGHKMRRIDPALVQAVEHLDHETAMVNVAAKKGIALSPGVTNDHNGEFVWVPFDCREHIKRVLGYHRGDGRESTRNFIELAQSAYTHADTISL